jgi:tetraacyldisaccharide 4'-kinase
MPPRHWQSRLHPVALALWPIAKLYGLMYAISSKLYDWGLFKTHKLPVPVVVVGNVVAGGVGKTPIVMLLVKRLQAMGLQPGVVSRGYGRKAKNCQIVTTNSTAAQVGDEPLLIAHSCQAPVVVASSRVQAAKALLARHPECNVMVSDDGLQHRALGRDLEIVVFDERGMGNHWPLPAGPLREPWPRKALGQTHLVLNNVPRRLAGYALNQTGDKIALQDLQGSGLFLKKLHALAGIAKPEAFFDMLRSAGLTLESTTAYADHDNFDKFATDSDANVLWLCTEKDAVKLWARYPQLAMQIVAVPLVVELDATFLAVFDATIAALIQH